MSIINGWSTWSELDLKKHGTGLELDMCFFLFMWDLETCSPMLDILLPFCIFHKMLFSYQCKASTNFFTEVCLQETEICRMYHKNAKSQILYLKADPHLASFSRANDTFRCWLLSFQSPFQENEIWIICKITRSVYWR